MRILVTGGAGFLGANLVRDLLQEDHNVVVLDDLSTGNRANVPDEAVFHVKHLGTAMCPDEWDELGTFDQIYHLACPASPPHYMVDPRNTLLTAFLGTHEVIEFARRVGARLVVASTSEVYGEPLSHPQFEPNWSRVHTLGPRACYDLGKAAAETLVSIAWGRPRCNVGMARIFNSYGPFMDPGDGRVVSNFICQALLGEPLTVFGDGQQTRSFCFVGDTVAGLRALMSSREEDVYNIGNPAERTVLFLAEKIRDMCKSSSPIQHQALPLDDPTRRRPDITKAMRDLDWSPSVGLDEGLQVTIEYFRARLRSM